MELIHKEGIFREQVFDDEQRKTLNLCRFEWENRRIICDSGDCSMCRIPQYAYLRNGTQR